MASKSTPLISTGKLFLVNQEKFLYNIGSCPRKVLGDKACEICGLHSATRGSFE